MTTPALKNERRLSSMEQHISDLEETNKDDHADIKDVLVRIETKLDTKTNNAEFVFWRNLLVSGIIISIFFGVLALLLERM